jgi:hypothetical protein
MTDHPTPDPMDNLAIVEPEIPHESVNEVIKRFVKFGFPTINKIVTTFVINAIADAVPGYREFWIQLGGQLRFPADRPKIADTLRKILAPAIDASAKECNGYLCGVIDDALAECGKRGVEDSFSHSTLEAVSELLKLFTEPAHKYDGRLLAHVLQMVINRESLSEVEIAALCGVTRARVSKLKVELQDRYGLRPRCGRSDEARAKFSQLVCHRRPRNKDTVWKAKSSFERTLRTESANSGKSSKKTGTQPLRRRASRPKRR